MLTGPRCSFADDAWDSVRDRIKFITPDNACWALQVPCGLVYHQSLNPR